MCDQGTKADSCAQKNDTFTPTEKLISGGQGGTSQKFNQSMEALQVC